MHYTDDDLILYYYGEGRRRAAIDRHLAACASCAETYRTIAGTLSMIGEPDVPERGDHYGLEVWQRIRHQLPEREPSWRATWLRWDRLSLAAAAAVLIVAAFVAGRIWPRPTDAPTAPTVARTSDTPTDVETRVLVA